MTPWQVHRYTVKLLLVTEEVTGKIRTKRSINMGNRKTKRSGDSAPFMAGGMVATVDFLDSINQLHLVIEVITLVVMMI